jgi:predicted PurR-regulated permease PerM
MMGIDSWALKIAWTVFLFIMTLAVLWYIRMTLVLFAAAIFFAYMLYPVVGVTERFVKRRRGLALAIVYCALIGVLVLLGFQLVPTLTAQALQLTTHLPSLVTGGNVAKLPLPHFLEPMREQVIPVLSRAATNLESRVVPFLQEAGVKLLSGLSDILPIILVPILAFFFLKDARSIQSALVSNFDDRQDQRMFSTILRDIHLVLRNYIRALVFLSLASFAAWAIFLSAMRYPYDLLLAGVSALLEFIPVVGPAAALVIVLVVCIVTGSGGLLWIVIFWAAFRIFQDYVLNPYLMSSGIELHPLLVLFGVLAGEALGGIPGMFFSVPVLAILRVVYNRMREASEQKTKAQAEYRPLPATAHISD